jgi:acyl carrier protein
MGDDVKEFVCHAIGIPFDTPDDFNYRKSGAVDSLGMVRLILSIEARFGFVFTDEDVALPEFNTVGGLMDVIGGKLVNMKKEVVHV